MEGQSGLSCLRALCPFFPLCALVSSCDALHLVLFDCLIGLWSTQASSTLVFDFGEKQAHLSEFEFFTGPDFSAADPAVWTMEASADGENWYSLILSFVPQQSKTKLTYATQELCGVSRQVCLPSSSFCWWGSCASFQDISRSRCNLLGNAGCCGLR